MKISENQRRVLTTMSRAMVSRTARECFTSIATMAALQRKGLVEISYDPPRSALSPSTMIEWVMTKEGLAAARGLLGREEAQ